MKNISEKGIVSNSLAKYHEIKKLHNQIAQKQVARIIERHRKQIDKEASIILDVHNAIITRAWKDYEFVKKMQELETNDY